MNCEKHLTLLVVVSFLIDLISGLPFTGSSLGSVIFTSSTPQSISAPPSPSTTTHLPTTPPPAIYIDEEKVIESDLRSLPWKVLNFTHTHKHNKKAPQVRCEHENSIKWYFVDAGKTGFLELNSSNSDLEEKYDSDDWEGGAPSPSMGGGRRANGRRVVAGGGRVSTASVLHVAVLKFDKPSDMLVGIYVCAEENSSGLYSLVYLYMVGPFIRPLVSTFAEVEYKRKNEKTYWVRCKAAHPNITVNFSFREKTKRTGLVPPHWLSYRHDHQRGFLVTDGRHNKTTAAAAAAAVMTTPTVFACTTTPGQEMLAFFYQQTPPLTINYRFIWSNDTIFTFSLPSIELDNVIRERHLVDSLGLTLYDVRRDSQLTITCKTDVPSTTANIRDYTPILTFNELTTEKILRGQIDENGDNNCLQSVLKLENVTRGGNIACRLNKDPTNFVRGFIFVNHHHRHHHSNHFDDDDDEEKGREKKEDRDTSDTTTVHHHHHHHRLPLSSPTHPSYPAHNYGRAISGRVRNKITDNDIVKNYTTKITNTFDGYDDTEGITTTTTPVSSTSALNNSEALLLAKEKTTESPIIFFLPSSSSPSTISSSSSLPSHSSPDLDGAVLKSQKQNSSANYDDDDDDDNIGGGGGGSGVTVFSTTSTIEKDTLSFSSFQPGSQNLSSVAQEGGGRVEEGAEGRDGVAGKLFPSTLGRKMETWFQAMSDELRHDSILEWRVAAATPPPSSSRDNGEENNHQEEGSTTSSSMGPIVPQATQLVSSSPISDNDDTPTLLTTPTTNNIAATITTTPPTVTAINKSTNDTATNAVVPAEVTTAAAITEDGPTDDPTTVSASSKKTTTTTAAAAAAATTSHYGYSYMLYQITYSVCVNSFFLIVK